MRRKKRRATRKKKMKRTRRKKRIRKSQNLQLRERKVPRLQLQTEEWLRLATGLAQHLLFPKKLHLPREFLPLSPLLT